MLALLVGFAFGFFGSIPVAGPIAALVLRRGALGRYKSGAWLAFGSAIPESVYAWLAFFGFATLLADRPWIELAARGVGAAILGVLAVVFLRYRPKAQPEETASARADSPAKSFWLGATITALNPTLLLTWTAATTTLYSVGAVSLDATDAIPFAVGAGLGIVSWFLALLALMRRMRDRFSEQAMARFIRGCGLMLAGLAIWFTVRFVSGVV